MPATEYIREFTQPNFSKEDIFGLQRTFLMYVKFPKSRWPEIEKAESDPKLFEKLSEEYIVFFVRAKVPKAKICFLFPTASYLAYANEKLSFEAQIIQPMTGQPPTITDIDVEQRGRPAKEWLYLLALLVLGLVVSTQLFRRRSQNQQS